MTDRKYTLEDVRAAYVDGEAAAYGRGKQNGYIAGAVALIHAGALKMSTCHCSDCVNVRSAAKGLSE